jgi:hypothetical protein
VLFDVHARISAVAGVWEKICRAMDWIWKRIFSVKTLKFIGAG